MAKQIQQCKPLYPHRSMNQNHIQQHVYLNDEGKEKYAAEFVWPSKAEPGFVPSLKPIQKNRQEELKFTFDVSKCDRIFDELLKNGNIRLSHAIPSPDELK